MIRDLLIGLLVMLTLSGVLYTRSQKYETLFINDDAIVTSSSKVLFFDWHDVCVQTRWCYAFVRVGQTEKSTSGKLKFFASMILASFDPRTWHAVWFTFAQQPKHASETFFNLMRHNGYEKIYREMIAFANNMYCENLEMVKLLQKLKDHEIPLYLFSNIGPEILAYGIENNLYPHLLPLFNNINSRYRDIAQDGIYPYNKPHSNAYAEVLVNTGVSVENAVMIDNKKKNLPISWAAGILFQNAQQCEKDLKKLGFAL